MNKPYRTIEEVLQSPWADLSVRGDPSKTDRVFRSTRLEDNIYADLRGDDAGMDEIEAGASEKLSAFPALSRDVYQAFYSLLLRRTEEKALSGTAKRFNKRILDHIMEGEDYPTIKDICEGRELPAYEAASEFVSQTAGELDDLLTQFGGKKGTLKTLEKLQVAERTAAEELAGMLERLKKSKERNETLENAAIDAANKAESKRRQVEAVGKMVDASTAQHADQIAALVAKPMKTATETAAEVQSVIGAWSDEPGNMERNEVNTSLLDHVRKSPALREIAKYLGRFREILDQGKRNGYAYGRGEKYSLELGADLSRALTSELAMLASPVTTPLFLRKYQQKQIKQYQRREPIYKGMGDYIVCLDESDSTIGDAAAWGKAVALTLLEIAADGKRNFALIHFSGKGSCQVDVFRPGEYTIADKMAAAETFLSGGTNFETPLREAVKLMETEGFEKADIVFITDGNCALPTGYGEELETCKSSLGFTITGILLDSQWAGGEFSLESFCQKIYRISEMCGEEIVKDIVNQRI